MPSSFSITTFNIDRFTTLDSFLEDYRRIGIDRLELNGRVGRTVLDALMPLIDAGTLTVSSLHAFCPKPDIPDSTDLDLSSPDEEHRRLAIGFAKRTIDVAGRVGAGAVVIHAGSVAGLSELERQLLWLFEHEGGQAAGLRGARTRLIEARRSAAPVFRRFAEQSLVELAEHIRTKALPVRLGLETPCHYYEIPSAEEYRLWFDRHRELPLDLWYDVGHQQALANLGLAEREPFLDEHADRLLGMHLHDCAGIHDHMVPGEGAIDFAFLRPYLRDPVIKVLEFGRTIQPLGRIVSGIEHLKAKGIL